jgi:hypothetical protein
MEEIDAQVGVGLVQLVEAADLEEHDRVKVCALKVPVLLACLRQLAVLRLGNEDARWVVVIITCTGMDRVSSYHSMMFRAPHVYMSG